MIKSALSGAALSLMVGTMLITGASTMAAAEEPTLSEEKFEHSKKLYFQRCAGCHGVLRKGATGKSLEPKDTKKLGQERLEKIIAIGTEGGMNNFDDLFSKDEIKDLATYIQMPAPPPAEMTLKEMKERWKVFVKPEDYPEKPQHSRNWENFFLVILRDAGKVGIIDGDTKEVISKVDTGYAVHVMKESSDGRFWFTQGRDGRMTKIDLWMDPPQVVAETQIASDARDVAVSHFGEWKDKYVIGGAYWPPHFVISMPRRWNRSRWCHARHQCRRRTMSTKHACRRGVQYAEAADLDRRGQGTRPALAGRLFGPGQPADRADQHA